MSSKGWDEDQESSRPQYQRARRRIFMQAANKLLEDWVSPQPQPPELEDESSQTKTAKRGMLVCQDDAVPWLVRVQRGMQNVLPLPSQLLMALVLTFLSWYWTGLAVLVVAFLAPMFPYLWCQQQVLAVFLWLLLVSNVFLLWLQEEAMLQLLVMVLVLVLAQVPVQTLKRCWRNLAMLTVYVMTLIFPLWCQAVVLLVLVLVTIERVMNIWRTRTHRHGGAHEWVLDSGAWIHHTSKLEVLLEGGDFQFQDMDNNNDAPSSGNDAPHVIQGRGSVRTGCFDFPGVHYVVGNDTRNVVSVSQLARDHGLVTVFEPTSCHIKDKKTGRIIGKGRLRNGIYMLDSLRIVSQYIGDGSGASGGDGRDGADGDRGGQGHKARGNGEGDSTTEGRGGGGRDGRRRERGTGGRNQEEGSGSGAAGGDVNGINEEEDGDENEIEETTNENGEYNINEIGEINGKGEKEEDDKRGGQNFGKLSSRPSTGLFRLSRFAYILGIVCTLCIATCISPQYTICGAGVLAVLVFRLFKTSTMQSTICKLKQMIGSLFRGTSGDRVGTEEERTPGVYYIQELSHQEHNKRLFGLSRFDATTDPRRQHLPARAFAMPTNTAGRPEEFFVDSGAQFHTTWKATILFPYPQHLENHTKPPTRYLGGIAAGSIAITRSGYLNGGNIMLDGVLLAPEAQANLVSVGQLSSYYGVQVEMDEVGVVIKKKQDGVRIGGGRMVSNLYVLEDFRPGFLFAH